MVFTLAIGFHNVEIPSGTKQKKFSVFLADTILVTDKEAEVLTDKAPKKSLDICYYLDTEDPNAVSVKEEKPQAKPKPAAPKSNGANPLSTTVIETKFRESTVQRKEEKSSKYTSR
jgi:nucleosome binding factor SPN SPT16 subunit